MNVLDRPAVRGGNNNCVEVAVAASAVAVRDSKNASGPTAWRNYTRSTRT